MNIRIDLKSLLCGLTLGVLATLAIGATTAPYQGGRFQIAGAANFFMVVDTSTGQVWGGNFNQLAQGTPAQEFKTCAQSSGDFFQSKLEK
jgi:hypothetical protein